MSRRANGCLAQTNHLSTGRGEHSAYGLPILVDVAYPFVMKTTLDIHDELLARAKRHAKETGQPLRAVVEDGLRHLIDAAPPRPYELPDLRMGDAEAADPLATYSWPELREHIYGTGAR